MKIRFLAIFIYFKSLIFKRDSLLATFSLKPPLSLRLPTAISLRAILFTTIYLFSPHTLATISATTYIVGGNDTEQEYPWMVALYQSGNYICGGVLISSHWIATAAHCVYEGTDDSDAPISYDASEFELVIGESTHYPSTQLARRSGITVHNITQAIINPNYDSNITAIDSTENDYDIALIELTDGYYRSGPALTTSTQFNNMPTGKALTLIGYGALSVTEDDDNSASEIIPDSLQQARLPYVPNDECYWNDSNSLSDNMLCAGYSDDTNIDACSGDSGSPLFSNLDGQLSLVGIVSWGASSCSGVPGVFTKVSNFRSWILSQIDGLQVVEEGTASNGTTGIISVYHYGENNDINDALAIGELNFQFDYSELFDLSDNCSLVTLYGIDESCNIEFSLLENINDDSFYEASLTINTDSMEPDKTYQITFSATTTANDIIETNSSNSATRGASLNILSLILLIFISMKRFTTHLFSKRQLNRQ